MTMRFIFKKRLILILWVLLLISTFKGYSQLARSATDLAIESFTAISKGIDLLYGSSSRAVGNAFNMIQETNHLYDDIIKINQILNTDLRFTRYQNRRKYIHNLEKMVINEYIKTLRVEGRLLGGQYLEAVQKRISSTVKYSEERVKEELTILKDISNYMNQIVKLANDIKNTKSSFQKTIDNIKSEKAKFVENARQTIDNIGMIKTLVKIAIKAQAGVGASVVGGVPTSDLVAKSSAEVDAANKRMEKAISNVKKQTDKQSNQLDQTTMLNLMSITASASEINQKYLSFQAKQRRKEVFHENIKYYQERLDQSEAVIKNIKYQTRIIRERVRAKRRYYKNLVLEDKMNISIYKAYYYDK